MGEPREKFKKQTSGNNNKTEKKTRNESSKFQVLEKQTQTIN